MDSVTMTVPEFEDAVLSRLDNIDKRLSNLEARWNRVDGALTITRIVIGSLGGLVALAAIIVAVGSR